MEETALAILPASDELDDYNYEYIEPIAEQTFNRKKLSNLEQSLGRLKRASRAHHESVTKLEGDMKSAVMVQDLQHALGLALEEVDGRVEELFKDSNKRLLSMFARRDDVHELQGLIGKKVNWADHNTALKKLSEMRTYIDTIFESSLVGHIAAINVEFAKKADAATVDESLEMKADISDLNELRARLERLEIQSTSSKQVQSTAIQELTNKSESHLKESSDALKSMISHTEETLTAIKKTEGGLDSRLADAEYRLQQLTESNHENREVNQRLQKEYKSYLVTGFKSLQDHLGELESSTKNTHAALESLTTDTKESSSSAQVNFKELRTQATTSKQQQDVLMDATEMLKRKLRELSKSSDSRHQELSDEQEKFLQQLDTFERSLKCQERDVRKGNSAQNPGPCHTARACTTTPDPGHGRSARAYTPDKHGGPGGDDLPDILEQLAKIASSPLQQDQALVDAQRPPLPWFDANKQPCTQGLELVKPLPRFSNSVTGEIPGRPGSVSARARLGATPRSKSARGARK